MSFALRPGSSVGGAGWALLANAILRAQKIHRRLASLKAEFNLASELPPIVYEHRHKLIFPEGFDTHSSASSSGHFEPYTVSGLYQAFIAKCRPGDPVESITVKSLGYGKLKTSVHHEFIIVEVSDLKAETLTNFLVLDRNQGTKKKKINTSRSVAGVAEDRMIISSNGNLPELLKHCGLAAHEVVEKMRFSAEKQLFLYQLIALALEVSRTRVDYHLGFGDCYWFAGIIWECIRRLHPDASCVVSGPRKGLARGRLGGGLVLGNVNQEEVNVVCERAQARMEEARSEFTAVQEALVASMEARLQQGNQEMSRKVAEIEHS